MTFQCDKVCDTCGYFHKSENFECEHWGDLPEDHPGYCTSWHEGTLPHNLLYRIQQLEKII
jgi:hypothetical protein